MRARIKSLTEQARKLLSEAKQGGPLPDEFHRRSYEAVKEMIWLTAPPPDGDRAAFEAEYVREHGTFEEFLAERHKIYGQT